jgi:hypothetical protein
MDDAGAPIVAEKRSGPLALRAASDSKIFADRIDFPMMADDM